MLDNEHVNNIENGPATPTVGDLPLEVKASRGSRRDQTGVSGVAEQLRNMPWRNRADGKMC